MSKMQFFAVAGNPILHSKSPCMFNSAFKKMGIDATYFRIAAHNAKNAVDTFKAMELKGMNVTAPFKEDIMPELDWIHEDAKLIGGVNAVVEEDGLLKGYNTDHYGVAHSLLNAGIDLKNKKCIVIGAGGAGKAAAYGMVKNGANVTIVNRTVSKAQDAAEKFGCNYAGLEELPDLMKTNDVIVFSLSQNINPIKEEWLESKHVIFDANYKKSPFIEIAEHKGCTIIHGLQWLLNQAIPAFSHFLGIDADREAMAEGLNSYDLHKKNKIISFVGFMASGKSANGKLVAQKLERKFADTDKLISERTHKSIPAIFEEHGEAYFRKLETEVVEECADTDEKMILSCGGGLIVNDKNRKLLKDNSLVIWTYTTPEDTVKRVKPGTRPLLEVENPLEVAKDLFAKRRDSYGKTADLVIFTQKGTKDQISDLLYEEISTAFGN